MEKKTNLLAIDLSTSLSSIAIIYKYNLYHIKKINITHNSQYIIFLINKLINKYQIPINNIHTLIFNKGPGSQMGIMISKLICKIFIWKYPNLNIISVSTYYSMTNKYYHYYHNNNWIIIIFHSIYKIYWYQTNKKIKILNYLRFIYELNLIKQKTIIISNNTIFKQKMNLLIPQYHNIWTLIKIIIIYPEAKYLI